MCWWILFVHLQGIAMGLVSLLVTPTRFIPPKQWNSLREYSRDGWVVTRWTLRWVFRDRGPVGAPCWWKQQEFQARTRKAFFQCEEFWNSLDIFQERWQSKEKIVREKIGRFVFSIFSEGMIPGGCPLPCFFLDVWFMVMSVDSKFYPELPPGKTIPSCTGTLMGELGGSYMTVTVARKVWRVAVVTYQATKTGALFFFLVG